MDVRVQRTGKRYYSCEFRLFDQQKGFNFGPHFGDHGRWPPLKSFPSDRSAKTNFVMNVLARNACHRVFQFEVDIFQWLDDNAALRFLDGHTLLNVTQTRSTFAPWYPLLA